MPAQPAGAAEQSLGWRTIIGVGCHETDGTCFVSLSGANYNTCSTLVGNQVRWDDGDQPNGRRTFAALLGAFLSGREVEVAFDGCSNQGFPKIVWYFIR